MEPEVSPDLYIDVGFYYMIGAALQRRVWCGDLGAPIYPNQYVVLCGPAGVGKGRVSSSVKKILSYHAYNPNATTADADATATTKPDLADINYFDANGHDSKAVLLLPMGPSATSYQAFARRMAECTRAFTLTNGDKKSVIAHASMHVVLDEFTTMFHDRAQDTVDFFLSCWMGDDYEHETIGRGKDYVKNPCLSLIAGTTPDRLRELKTVNILNSGLTRRLMLVYAAANRRRQLFIPDRTPEQMQSRVVLTRWVKMLNLARGPVKFSPDALAWLADWFKGSTYTINHSSSKVVTEYEATKSPIIAKTALAFHFAEPANWQPGGLMTDISLDTTQRAMEFLARTERDRHMPFEFAGRAEMAPTMGKIVEVIRARGPLSLNDIYGCMFDDFDDMNQCVDAVNNLMQAGRLAMTTGTKGVMKYGVK